MDVSALPRATPCHTWPWEQYAWGSTEPWGPQQPRLSKNEQKILALEADVRWYQHELDRIIGCRNKKHQRTVQILEAKLQEAQAMAATLKDELREARTTCAEQHVMLVHLDTMIVTLVGLQRTEGGASRDATLSAFKDHARAVHSEMTEAVQRLAELRVQRDEAAKELRELRGAAQEERERAEAARQQARAAQAELELQVVLLDRHLHKLASDQECGMRGRAQLGKELAAMELREMELSESIKAKTKELAVLQRAAAAPARRRSFLDAVLPRDMRKRSKIHDQLAQQEQPVPQPAPQQEQPAPQPAPQQEQPAPQQPAPPQPAPQQEQPAPQPAPQPEQPELQQPEPQQPEPQQPAPQQPAPQQPAPQQPAPQPVLQQEQPEPQQPAPPQPTPPPSPAPSQSPSPLPKRSAQRSPSPKRSAQPSPSPQMVSPRGPVVRVLCEAGDDDTQPDEAASQSDSVSSVQGRSQPAQPLARAAHQRLPSRVRRALRRLVPECMQSERARASTCSSTDSADTGSRSSRRWLSIFAVAPEL